MFELFRNRVFKNGNTQKDIILNENRRNFEQYLESSPTSQIIKINDEEYKVIINDVSFNNENKDDKHLFAKLNTPIDLGIYIEWNNENWLVIKDEKESMPIKISCRIRQCNNILKFYKNKTLHTLPCIIMSGSGNYLNLEDNKFLTTANSSYICLCADKGYIDKSDINMRFIINGSAYRIEGIDNISNTGLIKMELKDDEINPDDNLELGIANYYSNQQPTPSTDPIIVTLTPSDDKLMLGRSLELTAHCFVDGVEDFTKYYLYTITNADGTTNEYVTIDIRAEKCTITAKKNFEYAGKIINVHVALLGQPNIYYDRQIKLTALV